ncbi:MerR family transcriptional regulator, partial [Xanthomonas citri pv. citri]|nr:MerR family transcriptional regulator [Xanthomonas citri pv. citri]
QLDYWARTGLVRPEIRAARGSGSQRLYSFRDILMLKVVKRLLDAGVSLQQIRVAIDHLRSNGAEDLSRVTLMSDGVSV